LVTCWAIQPKKHSVALSGLWMSSITIKSCYAAEWVSWLVLLKVITGMLIDRSPR
jgi:hypothetical protein